MTHATDTDVPEPGVGEPDYDVLVIGSGFGGAVSALRLVEKGYRVGVLEAGRRYTDATLPKTSWRLRRFLWAPMLGLRGIQRITLLRTLVVLSGVGVGGGSLVYANVLYRAPERVFADAQWAHITDWAVELDPHYDTAERMLGVATNPGGTLHDEVLQQVAEDLGVGSTFRLTPSGVFFGEPGAQVADPYFGGEGPARRGCVFCAECMTGCRHGAKNRLDLNYLHLAERRGAVIHPDTEAVSLRELPGGGYEVRTRVPGLPWRPSRTYRAHQVVLAGGPVGTQRLLHRCKAEGTLPRLSDRLGQLTRTNSQSLLAAERSTPAPGFAHGVAITSSIHPDDVTHVEPVRYGRGSNFMGLLTTLLTDGGPGRGRRFLREARRDPRGLLGLFSRRRWSERTSILVVMQALDNSITVRLRSGLWGPRLTSGPGHGAPNPDWIPAGNDVARRVAEKIGGRPRGTWGELAGAPMTAHPIGGCVIGSSPATGVVDPYHRVYGHEGLHVVDGSTVPANLGANPALTITALAERALSLWPNRGETDPRPAAGEPYRRIGGVVPTGRVAPLPPR